MGARPRRGAPWPRAGETDGEPWFAGGGRGLGMKRSVSVALVAVMLVLATAGLSDAQDRGRHGFSGGHAGGHFGGHRGGNFGGHQGGHFGGHRGFIGHGGFGHGAVLAGVAPLFFWGSPYTSAPYPPAYAAPAYWYYCPSYGAYYPNVPSCPVPWVPVPVE